jgi:hypothetical protein
MDLSEYYVFWLEGYQNAFVVQVVGHLASKHEALSSNPSTEKKKKKGI